MGTTPPPTMTHTIGIKLDIIRSGSQERSYGPHVHEAKVEITLGENPVGAIYYLEEDYAKKVIRALVASFCDESRADHDGSMNDYFRNHLTMLVRAEFEERHRALWHVRIESPYTD